MTPFATALALRPSRPVKKLKAHTVFITEVRVDGMPLRRRAAPLR